MAGSLILGLPFILRLIDGLHMLRVSELCGFWLLKTFVWKCIFMILWVSGFYFE